jgi:hypothetical protein
MVAVIGQPDRLVGRHENAVRADENAFAPGPQQITLSVEHAHRMLAAIEGVDIVVLVDADGRDIGVELHAGREFCPTLGHLVAIAVRPEYHRHGVPLVFCVGAIIEAP